MATARAERAARFLRHAQKSTIRAILDDPLRAGGARGWPSGGRQGRLAFVDGHVPHYASLYYDRVDLFVLGANPILNALVLKAGLEVGAVCAVCNLPAEPSDTWGYGLLQDAGYRALVDKAAGLGMAEDFEQDWGLRVTRAEDPARLWLERFFATTGDLVSAYPDRAFVLDAGYRFNLGDRQTEDAAIVYLMDPAPPVPGTAAGTGAAGRAGAASAVRALADSAVWGGLTRRLPRLVFPPLAPETGHHLIAGRIVLTSVVPNFTPVQVFIAPDNTPFLHYRNPFVIGLGTARRKPLSARVSLEQAVEDLFLSRRIIAGWADTRALAQAEASVSPAAG